MSSIAPSEASQQRRTSTRVGIPAEASAFCCAGTSHTTASSCSISHRMTPVDLCSVRAGKRPFGTVNKCSRAMGQGAVMFCKGCKRAAFGNGGHLCVEGGKIAKFSYHVAAGRFNCPVQSLIGWRAACKKQSRSRNLVFFPVLFQPAGKRNVEFCPVAAVGNPENPINEAALNISLPDSCVTYRCRQLTTAVAQCNCSGQSLLVGAQDVCQSYGSPVRCTHGYCRAVFWPDRISKEGGRRPK